MLPFPRSWRGDGRMSRRSRRRRRVEPTDDWEQLLLLTRWPEQVRYELIRPVVLVGESAAERARETEAASERTLRRKIGRFEAEGMESLFDAEPAKRRELPPAIRRLVVDLKAEYPHLNTNEIAGICYVRFGRRPDVRTVRRVLEEEPVPLRMIRRYPPYHEIPEAKERRMAVVSLHAEGWTVKAIAGYLNINRDTVYHTLRRWLEEGADGLEDRPRGRPKGVRKVDLGAIDAVRRLQQNPELGAFRVHAALKQLGIELSPATCGRILALNRRLYGLEKPNAGGGRKREMPFASSRRHGYWTADVRFLDAVDEHLLGGRAYAISVLENHSRAILASAVSPTQDLPAFLSVLYRAVERYGSPEALVTDSGSIFMANQARAIYEALGIDKREIERGKPWQSYIETAFNIQRAQDGGLAVRPGEDVAGARGGAGGVHRGTVLGKGAGPTVTERMAGAPPPRCWGGCLASATTRRTWSAPSSRRASRASWTGSATPASGTGASTARKGSPGGRRRCGCRRRPSRWSTAGKPSPATMSSASRTATGWHGSRSPGCSRRPTHPRS